MTTRIQPDIELAVIDFLRSYAPLTATGAKVGSELPASPSWPFITVVRLGGPADFPGWLDHPRVQVDAWADTKAQAYSAIAAARAGLLDLPGVHDNTVITAADELTGPQWLPDPVANSRPRYFVVFSLTTHPVS